jgi:hypothetical protein
MMGLAPTQSDGRMPITPPAFSGTSSQQMSEQPGMGSDDMVSLSPEAEQMMNDRDQEEALFGQLTDMIAGGDMQQGHDIADKLKAMFSAAPPEADMPDPSALFDRLDASMMQGDQKEAQDGVKQIEMAMHF